MKRLLLPIVLGLCIHLLGCKKSVLNAVPEPSLIAAPDIVGPGRITNWFSPKSVPSCVPDEAYFHTNVWGLANGPSQPCPFYLSDQQSVKVSFTDGSFILCQPTVIDQYGTIGYGGAGLQDLNCTTHFGGFISYMDLHYYEPGARGAQSDASFPLYGCNSPSPYALNPIVFKRGSNYYITYTSSINTYYFPQKGQMIAKSIQSIEFI